MYRLILVVPICLMLLLTACATTERVPQRIVTIRNVVFDYIPPAGAEPGAAEMIIILVNPQYAASFEDARSEPFVSFAKSMGNDFEETLTTRGYKVMARIAVTTNSCIRSRRRETSSSMSRSI